MKRICSMCLILMLPVLLSSQSKDSATTLIFLADTQAPLWFEKVYLQYEENEKATALIFADILHEQDVAAVIHGGDLTSHGSDKRSWSQIRPFMDSLHALSIPFLAAKGNHDYLFSAGSAMRNFKKYVPESRGDYSSRKFGQVAIVLLNSNFPQLENSEILRQQIWYDSTLAAYQKDSIIRFVITVDHHPPFTNDRMVSGSQEVRKHFLPAFYRSSKAIVFVSGHAHRFEHFLKREKDFLVIGGGGGLLHDARENPSEFNLYDGADGGMFFHYVRCRASADSILFEVVKVSPRSAQKDVVHRFTLFPPKAAK